MIRKDIPVDQGVFFFCRTQVFSTLDFIVFNLSYWVISCWHVVWILYFPSPRLVALSRWLSHAIAFKKFKCYLNPFISLPPIWTRIIAARGLWHIDIHTITNIFRYICVCVCVCVCVTFIVSNKRACIWILIYSLTSGRLKITLVMFVLRQYERCQNNQICININLEKLG